MCLPLCLACGGGPGWSVGFQYGLEAYKNGDYKTAINEFS